MRLSLRGMAEAASGLLRRGTPRNDDALTIAYVWFCNDRVKI